MRRIVSAIFAAVVLTVFAVVAAPAAHAAGTQASGSAALSAAQAVGPLRMQFRHSGKCIDNPNFSTANVQLDQYTCVYQTNEYWYFDPVNSDGTVFRIRNGSSGKCMNVNGASTANNAAIIQYSCGSYSNEYFSFYYVATAGGKDYYNFVSYSSGRCLNISGASTANNAKLIQYTCGNYTNEQIALI